MAIWIFILGDEMLRRLLLLGFLLFGMSVLVLPTFTCAMSLDDDEEDAERCGSDITLALPYSKSSSIGMDTFLNLEQ